MNKIYQKTFPALKNAGFTLIELLVVVLIIGILAAVALPKYEIAVEKARAAEPLSVLKSLRDAQELYYMAYDRYTGNLAELDIQVPTGKYYTYDCSSGRTCFARPTIAGYPTIEFHMAQKTSGANDNYLGKHWCQFAGMTGDTTMAAGICKSLGPEDKTMTAGKYYMIGAVYEK